MAEEKERKLSFKKFLEQNGESGVKAIATDYGTTNVFKTIELISEENNISKNAVSSCIAYAIENCSISYNLCMAIKKKAHLNQVRHIGKVYNNPLPSDIYYDELLDKRRVFVRKIRGEKMRQVVEFYISNPYLSSKNVADALGYSLQEFSIILRNAIIFGVATDEESDSIIKTSLNKNRYSWKRNKDKEVLDKYLYYRHIYSAKCEEILVTQYQIENYDASKIPDEGETLEELKEKLKKLQEELQDFENIF